MLAAPHAAYMGITFGASIIMIALATIFVRRGVKQAEGSLWKRMALRIFRRKSGEGGERRRRARHVWANPVAWREAVTAGSAASNRFIYYGFIIMGVTAAVILLMSTTGPTGSAGSRCPAEGRGGEGLAHRHRHGRIRDRHPDGPQQRGHRH